MPRKTKVTRRGKNEGSVYQRKDGRWVGQVTVGYREDNGKPIRRYTYQATREEAARWVALQVATELDRAGSVRSGELLLRDFLHNWLAAFKVHEVCSRTMALYYDAERLHIAPALGDLPLGEVTPLKIQTFLYQLQAEKRLSQRTISLNKSVLVQMYDYAMELGLVENNPARNAKLPRQSRKIDGGEDKVIPIVQREQLLKAAESDPILCPILTLLMLTGMRIGEALALQWKHVDFQNRTISIQQSLTRELEFDGEGRTKKTAAALGVTKTRCSRRVIQAPDLVLQRLREWMRYLSKRKGGLEALVPEGFVFCSTRTMGMRTYSGFRASFRHFLERNGFGDQHLNLHRFRHTYASMLLEQEISPKVVQKLLGHRDVSTTLGVYSHVVPEVFTGVTAVVNTASEQLLAGTYAPRQGRERVLAQLRQLEALLGADGEGA